RRARLDDGDRRLPDRDAVSGRDRAPEEIASIHLDRLDSSEQIEVIAAVALKQTDVPSVHSACTNHDFVPRRGTHGCAGTGDAVQLRTRSGPSPDFESQHD